MTQRERLVATLRREATDRVPVSTYELTPWPYGWTLEEPSYRPLMEYILDHTVILGLWGASTAPLPDAAPTESETWQDNEYVVKRTTIHTPLGDLFSTAKYTPSVKTTWVVEHLCKDEEDVRRYLSLPLALGPVNTSSFPAIDAAIGERGVVLCDIGDAVGHVAPLFEFGEFTILAMTEPAMIRECCDRAHVEIMHRLRGMLEAGCGPIYRIWGPEYVTPPYLPPSSFKEFVVPYVSEMIDLIHQYGCYARIHAHGRIGEVVEMMVEMGADATDPVEPPPDGDITMGAVKARFGDRLVLFGNMELKYLEQETPAEIDARVKVMMDEAKAGGGFVLMPTAAPINIPLSPRTAENYRAFIEAGLRYGRY